MHGAGAFTDKSKYSVLAIAEHSNLKLSMNSEENELKHRHNEAVGPELFVVLSDFWYFLSSSPVTVLLCCCMLLALSCFSQTNVI